MSPVSDDEALIYVASVASSSSRPRPVSSSQKAARVLRDLSPADRVLKAASRAGSAKGKGRSKDTRSLLPAQGSGSDASEPATASPRPKKRKRTHSVASSVQIIEDPPPLRVSSSLKAGHAARVADADDSGSRKSSSARAIHDHSRPTPANRPRALTSRADSRRSYKVNDSSAGEILDDGSDSEEVISVATSTFKRPPRASEVATVQQVHLNKQPAEVTAKPRLARKTTATLPRGPNGDVVVASSPKASTSATTTNEGFQALTSIAAEVAESQGSSKKGAARSSKSRYEYQGSSSNHALKEEVSALEDKVAALESTLARKDKQITKEKMERVKLNDSFNEQGHANYRLSQKVEELQKFILAEQQKHEVRLKSGAQDADHMTVELAHLKQEREAMKVRMLALQAENDKITIAMRSGSEQQRKSEQEFKNNRESRLAAEIMRGIERDKNYEARIAGIKQANEEIVEQLHRDLDVAKSEMAIKDSQIKSLVTRHAQETSEMQHNIQQLQERLKISTDVAGAAGHSEHGDGVAGEDATALRRRLSKLDRQYKAFIEYAEAQHKREDYKIKGLQAALQEKDEKQERFVEQLEKARHMLEGENERYRSKLKSLTDEKKVTASNASRLKALELEIERLREEHPQLRQEIQEISEERQRLINENTNQRKERSLYTNEIEKVRREAAAAISEANELRTDAERFRQEHEQMRNERQTYLIERKRSEKEKSELPNCTKALKRLIKQGKMAEGGSGSDSSGGSSSDDAVLEEADAIAATYDDSQADDVQASDFGAELLARRLFSPEPHREEVVAPPTKALVTSLHALKEKRQDMHKQAHKLFEDQRPKYTFPPLAKERRPESKVPRMRSRVYVRSECHTPYVPDETVSDSDDEFLEWESQAYARSQASNPDTKAATVNICWNRWILDARSHRVRSQNLAFCTGFVRSYGSLIASREAGQALLKHILGLVKLGQLSADEGSIVIKAYRESA